MTFTRLYFRRSITITWALVISALLVVSLVKSAIATPEVSYVRNINTAVQEPYFYNVTSMALDSDQNVYVARDNYGNNDCKVLKFSSDGELLGQWGVCGTGVGQFQTVMGMTISSDGYLYLAEQKRVQKFDLSGNYITGWGSNGTGNGQFTTIYDIDTDADNNVYVLDFGSNRVQKFTSDGTFVSVLITGIGSNPQGIDLDGDGNIYVADTSNRLVKRYSSAGGAPQASWGVDGSGGGGNMFGRLTNVAVDSNNHVYALDGYNHKVYEYNATGILLNSWGQKGAGNGQFHIQDSGIVAKASMEIAGTSLYMTDLLNARIDKFGLDGSFITKWGRYGGFSPIYGRQNTTPNGNLVTADNRNHIITVLSSDGSSIVSQLSVYPYGITQEFEADIDTEGNYIVFNQDDDETDPARMYIFNAQGQLIKHWSVGDKPMESMTVDRAGHIYITDGNLATVKKYDYDGNLLDTLGTPFDINTYSNVSRLPGNFAIHGIGLTTDADNNLYVSDTANNRIQKFSPSGEYLMSFAWEYEDYTFPGLTAKLQTVIPAVDGNGNSYIPDAANQQIIKKDSDGNIIDTFGSAGSGNGQLSLLDDKYTRIIVVNNELFIADTNNNRIEVFDLNGQYVRQFGGGQLSLPTDMLLDTQGNLQIADALNNRIAVFNTNGTFVSAWGNTGSGEELLATPIFIIRVNGEYLVFNGSEVKKYNATNYTYNGTAPTAYNSAPYGSTGGLLTAPTDVSVDEQGNVFVADKSNGRIVVYNRSGDFVVDWGEPYHIGADINDPMIYLNPISVAIGQGGQVFVGDGSGGRVRQYTVAGLPIPTPPIDPTDPPTPTNPPNPAPTSPTSTPRPSMPTALENAIPPTASDTKIVLTITPGKVFMNLHPVLTGYTVPYGWVEVTVHSKSQTGKVQADGTGYWEWQPPLPLEPGEHTYTARVINEDGSYGITAEPVAFSVSSFEDVTVPLDTTPAQTQTTRSIPSWWLVAPILVMVVLGILLLRRRRSRQM